MSRSRCSTKAGLIRVSGWGRSSADRFFSGKTKGPAPRGAGFFVPASHLATMFQLHMTRVAVGCADYPALQARIANYAQDGEIRFTTRFKPKRADELIGGKRNFIVKHTLVEIGRAHV